MERMKFLVLIVASALLSDTAWSFVILQASNTAPSSASSSTCRKYAESAVGPPLSLSDKKTTTRPTEASPTKLSLSKLYNRQIAREFSASQRYGVAAVVLTDQVEQFLAAEEEQRMRAIQMIEYANANDIPLDYQSQIVLQDDCDSSSLQSLGVQELATELMAQERLDRLFFQEFLQEAHTSDDPLAAVLEPLRVGVFDILKTTGLLDHDLGKTQQLGYSYFDLLKTNDDLSVGVYSLDHPLIEQVYASRELLPLLDATSSMPISSSPFLQQHQQQPAHRLFLEPISRSAHITPTDAYVGVAVDTDYDALQQSLVETSEDLWVAADEALPSMEDFLDALSSIGTEDTFFSAVDNSAVGDLATFLEEQTNLMDSLQQNIFEAEGLAQIAEILAQLY
jgi:hypothetical protein